MNPNQMMKYSLLLILGFLCTAFSVVPVKYPVYLQKKINKEINKNYDAKEIITELVDDSVFNTDYHETDLILIKNELNQELGYVTVTLASACKIGGCTIGTEDHSGNMSEEFYFMVAYDMNSVIKKVKILEYDSTYGYEIAAKGWLKQFIGKVGGSLEYEKDIDGISGATISVKSLIKEINMQNRFLNNATAQK